MNLGVEFAWRHDTKQAHLHLKHPSMLICGFAPQSVRTTGNMTVYTNGLEPSQCSSRVCTFVNEIERTQAGCVHDNAELLPVQTPVHAPRDSHRQ